MTSLHTLNSYRYLQALAKKNAKFVSAFNYFADLSKSKDAAINVLYNELTKIGQLNSAGDYTSARKLMQAVRENLAHVRSDFEVFKTRFDSTTQFTKDALAVLAEYKAAYQAASSYYQSDVIMLRDHKLFLEIQREIEHNLSRADELIESALREAIVEHFQLIDTQVLSFGQYVYSTPKINFLLNFYVPGELASVRSLFSELAQAHPIDVEQINEMLVEANCALALAKGHYDDFAYDLAQRESVRALTIVDAIRSRLEMEQEALDTLSQFEKTIASRLDYFASIRLILSQALQVLSEGLKARVEFSRPITELLAAGTLFTALVDRYRADFNSSQVLSSELVEQAYGIFNVLTEVRTHIEHILQMYSSMAEARKTLSVDIASLRLLILQMSSDLAPYAGQQISAKYFPLLLNNESELANLEQMALNGGDQD
ncbi:unnamed protein product, partial [Didymodactylos carnosus]